MTQIVIRRTLVTVLLAVMALSLTSCQQATPKPTTISAPIPGLPGVQVNSDTDAVTIKNTAGESMTVSTKVPDELKAFPVPAGFALDKDGFGSLSTRDGSLSTGTWVGSGSLDSVADFYTRTLPQQGWTQSMSMDTDDSRISTFDKGDHQAWLNLEVKDQSTKISVMYSTGGRATATSVAVPIATSTAVVPATTVAVVRATATPEAPALVDASTLPVELRAIPLPTGFGIVKGSTQRMSEGSAFRLATAQIFGKSSAAEVTSFYKQALSSQWHEEAAVATDDGSWLQYTNTANPALNLSVSIEKVDAGTEATILMSSDK